MSSSKAIVLPSGAIKSSHSGANGNGCVSLRADGDAVVIAHSVRPELGSVAFTPHELAAFILGVRDGEFDHLADFSEFER
ncbi:DUF397 domain-containing protein [Kitasatospora acidiphila]|uniref:DUF397 domain-containing protein n=1 Tax=Kitasatospora acidiphila TaxID=2567942 RepID=A0A540W9W6_9ACTN|nr:DUF397 domain-containing protein [Kitasatospora acidiphila]TQF05819.1 DUF397 domain-containing protein [Kitasatospora acidiphila]